MDPTRAVSLITVTLAFATAYSVQHEFVWMIGEQCNFRPTRAAHLIAGLIFAAGISAALQPILV